MSDQAISEAERWFLKRGLPHFIDDYSPTRDVLTRAVPLLTLIFLVEVANAPKRDFPIWLDVVAVAVGFGILLGAWMVANRIRGRPPLARPESVGVFEVAVFVLAPPAIPLIFGGQWRSALATALGNLLLLVVIFLGTSYGVVPMTRWAGGRTIRELEQVMSLLVRALPLLILFITFRVRRAGRDRAGRPRLHGRGAERARDLRPLGPADGHHRGAAARDRLPDGLRR
ncbi:MAG TPA: hypothetical protein VKH36_16300, partial [Acidimicrobiia bacterium]|nr:hypothetical protein [Acidimicrobiia bacterium]